MLNSHLLSFYSSLLKTYTSKSSFLYSFFFYNLLFLLIKLGLIDQAWGDGYKNDVWSMRGTDWTVVGDNGIKTTSQLKWTQLTPGKVPKPGQTYNDYLVCESVFANVVSTHFEYSFSFFFFD